MRASRTSALALALTVLPLAAAADQQDPLLWPEEQRAFLQDGPSLLLQDTDLDYFEGLDEAGRADFIEAYLAEDPLPSTPANELREGIERRRLLIRAAGLSPRDVRAQLLFLHGTPVTRKVIDCGSAFKPLEMWSYREGAGERILIVYQPNPGERWRLWLPLDSKRSLYTPELEYFLDQWEELRRFIIGKRFDYQICPDAVTIDRATGVNGLTGFAKDRPGNEVFQHYLRPPASLAGWAERAAATQVPAFPEVLELDDFTVQYPKRDGQRMVARLTALLPAEGNYERALEGEEEVLDLAVEGVMEQDGKPFDTFRVRFTPTASEEPKPVALVVERPLRPGRTFLLRLRVVDEVGGAELLFNRSLVVPVEPVPVDLPPLSDAAVLAIGHDVSQERMPGMDSLVLVPPESDVVLGLWRAEALVTGERIERVLFFVDDKQQLARSRPPFSAEVRLAKYPTEQVVRAEGYDAAGEMVAADEVIVNQPRGALRVRILSPKRGGVEPGTRVTARAEVVVPEGRRVEKVSFLVNDEEVESLEKPPWEAEVEAPLEGELNYLTVVAELDDETRAEDVRFFSTPEYLEEVDVSLVELFTTVTDSSGRLAKGLVPDDFEVLEDGRAQEIVKFELVEDLPLTIGITIDTSGSMVDSMIQAQQAATDFLDAIVTRRDRCFAISFSNRPVMLMPPTNDVEAVSLALQDLTAGGFTSLYDAIVHSLYYFRGVRGRRALVLLSDGEDTSSNLAYSDALEYARRSGVAVYTIGLGVGGFNLGLKNQLKNLSDETGGRHFFIKNATELTGVYREIEEELRSQYLIAYSSNNPQAEGTFRAVDVKVKKRGLDARTTRGYYE